MKKQAISLFKWWLGTESNRRHTDFQSVALPTELPSLYSIYKNLFTRFIMVSKQIRTMLSLLVVLQDMQRCSTPRRAT